MEQNFWVFAAVICVENLPSTGEMACPTPRKADYQWKGSTELSEYAIIFGGKIGDRTERFLILDRVTTAEEEKDGKGEGVVKL